MLIYSLINDVIKQYPFIWHNFKNGGDAWERSGLFHEVYTLLKEHDLVSYEVASRGDPYALVESYLATIKNLAHASLAL